MKKIFVTILLLLTATFSFAEEFRGFNGLDFGASMAETHEYLRTKGVDYPDRTPKKIDSIWTNKVSWGGMKGEMTFNFIEDKLYSVHFFVMDGKNIVDGYEDPIVSQFISKYNLTVEKSNLATNGSGNYFEHNFRTTSNKYINFGIPTVYSKTYDFYNLEMKQKADEAIEEEELLKAEKKKQEELKKQQELYDSL